jgi:hypothetical protein
MSQKGQQFGHEAGYVARSTGSRIGKAIGIIFKAFFLFFAGVIAFALLIALIALMTAGIGVFPLKDFFLEGFSQNMLAWATLLLFLGVPVVAFITWVIRRLMGVKSGNKYIGFTFAGLWVIGLVCGGILAASIARNFDAAAKDKQEYTITQPVTGKLIVNVPDSKVKVYGRWFRMDGVMSMSDDSLFLNNVRLHLVKSNDSLYHITANKYSNGPDETSALHNVQDIHYSISQEDSLIHLDRGFSLQKGTRFRNQHVTVIMQIPVGKKIVIKGTVSRRLNSFHINAGRNDWDFDEEWNNSYENWSSDIEYIMTPGGLERVNKKKDDDNNDEEPNDAVEKYKKSKEQLQKEYDKKQKEAEDLKKELEKPVDSTKYHYKKTTTYVITPNAEKIVTVEKGTEGDDTATPAEISRLAFMQMVL